MLPEDFIQNPWKEQSTHEAYTESFLHMRPAPEYASGEVVLASLYRNVGFPAISESKVPTLGRDFLKRIERDYLGKKGDSQRVGIDAWRGIITGSLRSPKQPNQAAKRFLQICPIVPDATAYSLSARLSANSWNPGQLVGRVIGFGQACEARAYQVWLSLFEHLSVDNNDDVWARFLQEEFVRWRKPELAIEWKEPEELLRPETISRWHQDSLRIPASQFRQDLECVMDLKEFLTRRQWISMVESVLRLGTASHVMWLCRANHECLMLVEAVLNGDQTPTAECVRQRLGLDTPFWNYGQIAARTIKEYARDFVIARAGLNLVLWHCQELQSKSGLAMPKEPLSNASHIAEFLGYLASIRSSFPYSQYEGNLRSAIEADPRVAACKKGITCNITEFLRHVLGQRQTSEPGMESYDQGYYLRKRGSYSSAPWIMSFGPVAVLMLVHGCTHKARGPRTVEDLCRHLAGYGIEARAQDVVRMDLGKTLRNLGLVLDSPDAEGGMVLVSPFKAVLEESRL